MIRRNDEEPIHSWQHIQRIKNEIFGEERTALEVYPKESRLVDMANLYWLWVLPDDYVCPIESKGGFSEIVIFTLLIIRSVDIPS